MRILLVSHAFAPQVGGIETMSLLLAREFAKAGHEVMVVTHTPTDASETESFAILRAPSMKELLNSVRWSEIIFHNNVCMRFAWPLTIIRRPWVVTHQTWIRRTDGRLGLQDVLKRGILRWSCQVSISKAIAEDVIGSNIIIGNCYDDQLFAIDNRIQPDKDLVFLGRLVSDKGADLVIEAVKLLRDMGIQATLTIIGEGSELTALKSQSERLGLESAVEFAGQLTGKDLVNQLRQHKILVVPSRWAEPFGIVALEGAASGCIVVGSSAGGLTDAIGPCGRTFPNGDVNGLVEVLRELLSNENERDRIRLAAKDHLAIHTPSQIAARYLEVFEGLIG